MAQQRTELLKVSAELEEQLSIQLSDRDVTQAHDNLVQECESLRREISDLVATHHIERDSDKRIIEELQGELAVSTKRIEELELEIDGTASEMKLNGEHYVLKNTELQAELAELRGTVERLRACESELEQLRSECASLQLRLTESDRLSSELRIALDASNKENIELNERYAGSSSALGDELAVVQSQLVEQQRIAEELRNRLLESDSLRSQLSVELERELISASIKLDELKLLEEERDTLRATVGELHSKVASTKTMTSYFRSFIFTALFSHRERLPPAMRPHLRNQSIREPPSCISRTRLRSL